MRTVADARHARSGLLRPERVPVPARVAGEAGGPDAAAIIVYLHISGVGPLLGSGFWLIASERFDPRTAKQRFGQIAGAGTLGGLAERPARRTRGRRCFGVAGDAAASGAASISSARGRSAARGRHERRPEALPARSTGATPAAVRPAPACA